MRIRHWIYAVVAIVALVIAAFLIRADMQDPTERLWHAAPFFGSMLITVGWIVTSEMSIRNSKKQHTIGLINQHRFGAIREKNLTAIQKILPTTDAILTSGVANFDEEGNESLRAIDAELNFYDFAAAAVRRDDIDEALLQACLHGQLTNLYKQTELYINHWRKKDPLIWCDVVRMRNRWARRPPKIVHTRDIPPVT